MCILFNSYACSPKWLRDVEMDGIKFKKIKTGDSGIIIGYLNENTTIQAYPCKKGWIHLYKNKNLKSFTLEKSALINNIEIPSETWATLNEKGDIILCAFPENMEIQGHLCRGTGGSKGVQVSFYESGALKMFFSPESIKIQGVLCKGGVFNHIGLHENGKLKTCTLQSNTIIDSVQYNKGERLRFDITGRVIQRN
jgi:hypothetical protein